MVPMGNNIRLTSSSSMHPGDVLMNNEYFKGYDEEGFAIYELPFDF